MRRGDLLIVAAVLLVLVASAAESRADPPTADFALSSKAPRTPTGVRARIDYESTDADGQRREIGRASCRERVLPTV